MLTNRVDEVADTLSDTEITVAGALHAGISTLGELTTHLAMDDLALWRTVLSMRERGLIASSHPASTLALPAMYGQPHES
jgi:hypothetical protein